MLEMLEKLISFTAVSGNEEALKGYITDQILPFVDKVYTDPLGNLIAHKKGDGNKVMICAHMDTAGIVVTRADDRGFLKVAPVGPIKAADFLYKSVIFENGKRGMFCAQKQEEQSLNFSDCYVDIGAGDEKEALSSVAVGSVARFEGALVQNGNRISGAALDNAVGCLVLLQTIQKLKQNVNDIYFVFSAQKEVGARGAAIPAGSIGADICISVDVTEAGDQPGAQDGITELGGGAAVKIRDGSAMCSKSVVQKLEAVAEFYHIPTQRDVVNAGTTDIGGVQKNGVGARIGGLGIPCRYLHTPAETVSQKDAEACIGLLCALLSSAVIK